MGAIDANILAAAIFAFVFLLVKIVMQRQQL